MGVAEFIIVGETNKDMISDFFWVGGSQNSLSIKDETSGL